MTIFYLILYLILLAMLFVMNMNLVSIKDQLEYLNESIDCTELPEEEDIE
jgi:hypothetical protein